MGYSSPSHANIRVNNGSTDTSGVTFTYDIPVRQILIVNDDASGNDELNYYFNGNSADVGVLKPQESVSMWVRLNSLTISSATNTVSYRTVAMG